MNREADDAIYRVVVEADPNLVFITDPRGRVIRVNSRWMEYVGISADEINREHASPLHIVHPEDLQRTWSAWKGALESGEPYQISYRLRSAKDGRYRWFVARAIPHRDESGTIVGWYGAATDVHAQVRAADRASFLSEASAALNSSLDRDRIVDAFVQTVLRRFSPGLIVILRDEHDQMQRVAIAHRDPATEARARERMASLPFQESSHSGKVIEHRQSLFIPDIADESRTGWKNARGTGIIGVFEDTNSIITVPLVVAERVAGLISFVATGDNLGLDEYDLETAEAVGRQAATAFEHAAIFARERKTAERFRYLAHATDQLFGTRDLGENLETFLQSLVGYWAHRAILFVLGIDGSVRAHAVANLKPELSDLSEEFRGQRIFVPEAEARFRQIIAHRKSWLRTDVTRESINVNIHPYLHHVVDKMPPQSLMVIPLYTAEFDFGALGVYLDDRNFDEDDREMFEELGRRLSLALEHTQSIGRERRLARTLQELTLPAALPSIAGAVLSTTYATATTSDAPVGGDWYDAFHLPDGRTVMSIGDVTGSGLQASAIMGKLRHAINAVALYEDDPARILDMCEYIMLQRYPDAIATAFLAIVDTTQRRISYANAGHPHPIVRCWDGSVELLTADGLPIGSRMLGPPTQSRTRTLEDAAMIAFYTDGVTEATRDVQAGEKRIIDAVATEGILYVRAPATMLSDACIPDGPHDDDAALMVLSFPRSIGWSFEAENARAAQTARGGFIARLRAEAAEDSDFSAAEIVFGELVGNVVRHAPGSIDVALEWRDDRAVLHVVDRGPGFEYRPPAKLIDLMSESGRGLWLAHQFGEEVTAERLPGFGSHVSVVLPIRRAATSSTAGNRKRAKAPASGQRSAART